MRKDGDKPNCCTRGDKYIWWRIASDTFANNMFTDPWCSIFTDWGMVVGYFDEDIYEGPVTRQIGYCPFCGKKLDWADEILAAEQEAAHNE